MLDEKEGAREFMKTVKYTDHIDQRNKLRLSSMSTIRIY
jgi:hypothetical protein